VRSGPYATGIFRFSIQFSIASEHLALPTVFFPPILLHPIVEPASGRLNLLPYLALAQESDMPTDPDDPAFLCSLLTFLADCFSSRVLNNLCEQWILNERVYSYVPLAIHDQCLLRSASKTLIMHFFAPLQLSLRACPIHLSLYTMLNLVAACQVTSM